MRFAIIGEIIGEITKWSVEFHMNKYMSSSPRHGGPLAAGLAQSKGFRVQTGGQAAPQQDCTARGQVVAGAMVECQEWPLNQSEVTGEDHPPPLPERRPSDRRLTAKPLRTSTSLPSCTTFAPPSHPSPSLSSAHPQACCCDLSLSWHY